MQKKNLITKQHYQYKLHIIEIKIYGKWKDSCCQAFMKRLIMLTILRTVVYNLRLVVPIMYYSALVLYT